MGIFDLFSKRQRRARGEVPDVYVYDQLPKALRVQIVHIIRDAFGQNSSYGTDRPEELYEQVEKTLAREYGLFSLMPYADSRAEAVIDFFVKEQSAERAFDVVELCFKCIDTFIRNNTVYRYNTVRELEPDDAIAELNGRFKEHGVGYQFESGELIRVDSDFLHAEAVKPTLAILRTQGFEGPNEEFLQAHEHYRHKRYKECLVDCLKSFESTMKAICKVREWEIQANGTAKTLIEICIKRGLLPPYLEAQFGAIRSLLESGVPTLRNKLGGHGQGPEPLEVPEYFARYVLNLTATSILFLTEANSAQK